MHKDFLFIDEVVPGIRWDAKYATWDNFTGKPVDGYYANRIVGSRALCDALLNVQKAAYSQGFGLLLWDAYRPQRAVDCFIAWAKMPEDNSTKAHHYPNHTRTSLFTNGYIAKHSGHSRGGAVDLTLYRLTDHYLLPMGGSFDLMDPVSHHGASGIAPEALKNRKQLRSIMEDNGFNSYENEWWHYILSKEPYPDRYFDFAIE